MQAGHKTDNKQPNQEWGMRADVAADRAAQTGINSESLIADSATLLASS